MITEVEFVAIKAFDRAIAENTSEAQRIINKKNAELFALQNMIKELQDSLVVTKASLAGITAQAKAMASAHPDSPLLKHTGKFYTDGRKQTVAGLMFDESFDEKAKELGHKNPLSIRLVAE